MKPFERLTNPLKKISDPFNDKVYPFTEFFHPLNGKVYRCICLQKFTIHLRQEIITTYCSSQV